MNLVKIGRYTLPLLSVIAIRERKPKTGWRKLLFWQEPGYDVLLNNSQTIHFTEEEKQIYDTERGWHDVTVDVWGACKSAGLRA